MSSNRNSKSKPKTNPKAAPAAAPVKPRRKSKKGPMIAAIAIIAIVVISVAAYAVLSQGSKTPQKAASFVYPTVTSLTGPAGEYSANGTEVIFITNMGNIVIQLRNDKPITTTNFINLVREGYYNNTVFQRVIAGFMIQGGEGATTVPTIQDEIGNVSENVNSNMTIAMANTGAANSASSQFFINVANNNGITYSDGVTFDSSYTVFGQVIYGMNTVMAISNTPVEYSAAYNANVQPVNTVTLIGAAIMP